MPIRFPCPECQQRLSVTSQKAGREVRCPRCRQTVLVPSVPTPPAANRSDEALTVPPAANESEPGSVPPPPSTPDPGPVPETELVYADAPLESAAAAVDASLVTLPRRYVYYQGFLLGAVALCFFVFGMIVGSRSGPTGPGVAIQPCTISGEIRFQSSDGDKASPDEGARVIVVPQAVRPDQKAAASGLRPGDQEPAEDHVGVALLRGLGGDVASVDNRGRFQCRVPSPGRYYILVISRHAQRSEDEPLEGRDLAQIGRYISPAATLLNAQQYTWQELRVRGDCTIEHQF